jgi:hypothetical protein
MAVRIARTTTQAVRGDPASMSLWLRGREQDAGGEGDQGEEGDAGLAAAPQGGPGGHDGHEEAPDAEEAAAHRGMSNGAGNAVGSASRAIASAR